MTSPRDTEAAPAGDPQEGKQEQPGARPDHSGPQADAPPRSPQQQAAEPRQPEAVPRAGGASRTPEPGPGWAQQQPTQTGTRPDPQRSDPTTVLPGARASAGPPRPAATGRTTPPRPAVREGRSGGASGGRPLVGRSRRARLTLKRIDPWSVFLFSLVASIFVGIAMVVAVAVLYAVLGSLGVTESLNELFAEVTGGSPTTGALLTSGRIIGGAAVLAAVNVVFLTLLSTLSAMLYNLCASFTGGIEVTLGERE